MIKQIILPILAGFSLVSQAASGPSVEHINRAKIDKKGKFSPQLLAQFLNKSDYLKKSNKDFAHVKEAQIKRMSAEAGDARWGTSQLFRFTSNNGRGYIIKEINASAGNGPLKEIERLDRAANSARLEDWTYPRRKPGHPQFIFPNAHLSYTFNGKRRYIVVMPAAQGTSLMDYMKGFKSGYKAHNSPFVQEAAKAFFHVGRKMSRFYETQRRARKDNSPILHGDFHMGNIFFDSKSNHVTLIDNERVCNSFNTCKSRAEDVAFLTLKSMFVAKWNNGSFFNDFPKRCWYDLFLPCFISGFLSVYKKDVRLKQFYKLKEWIQQFKDPKNGVNWYHDKKMLGFKHRDYMKSVFDRIEKSKLFFSIDTQNATKHFKGGRTLLHDAAKNNGETICIWPLIGAGADIHARDNDNNIPLHEAAWSNREEAIKRLIFAGSNKHAEDRHHATPLNKAKYNDSHNAAAMLKTL